MRRGVAIALVIVVLGGIAGAGLYWRWVNSPVYSLHQMVTALKARNHNEFFNYLIIKDIVGDMVDASSKELLLKPGLKEDEATKIARFLGQRLASQYLPKLLGGLDKQIRSGLEAYLRQLTDQQIQALAEAVKLADVQTEGDESQVTLKDRKTGELLHLTMRRSPKDRTWRVVAVSYEDLKRLIKREFL